MILLAADEDFDNDILVLLVTCSSGEDLAGRLQYLPLR